MISAFFGVPGSGKSLALAWVARRALSKRAYNISFCGIQLSVPHKRIFTNFECPGCYKLNYEDLGKYNFEDSLILIDEIMMYSDSRDFKTFSADLKFFFSQHRKFNIDIVWTSQSYDDSDKKIRNLTTNFFLVEGSRLPYFSKITHISPCFDIVEGNPKSFYKWGRISRFYRKPLFKWIDSYATIKREKQTLPPAPLVEW